MAIKIKSLEKLANSYTQQQHIYQDLTLDIAQNKIVTRGFPFPVPGKDIEVSLDYAAIRNSLTNLFNTIPGQRFLFPDYGLDLRQFLFLPITRSTARLIGDRIHESVSNYEPRVNIINVNVQSDPDNNKYNISLIMSFPTLNTTNTVNYALDIKNQSFILLPSN
jgi:hypothetical protein